LGFNADGQLGDFGQLTASAGDLRGRFIEFTGLLLDVADHRLALGTNIADHPPDLFGGAAGTSGKVAHLVGYHREASSAFTRAGRLNGGVEREQVGLAGNGLDYVGDLPDFLGT